MVLRLKAFFEKCDYWWLQAEQKEKRKWWLVHALVPVLQKQGLRILVHLVPLSHEGGDEKTGPLRPCTSELIQEGMDCLSRKVKCQAAVPFSSGSESEETEVRGTTRGLCYSKESLADILLRLLNIHLSSSSKKQEWQPLVVHMLMWIT